MSRFMLSDHDIEIENKINHNFSDPSSYRDKSFASPSDNILRPTKWSSQIEEMVKDIARKSEYYHKVHTEVALSYSCQYTTLMIFLMTLSPVAGSLTLLSFIAVEQAFYFNLLVAVFSFISGILASVVKFAKYDETSNAHKIASSRYFSLYNNAVRELSLPKQNRADANSYSKWISISYDELYQSSPLLPLNKQKDISTASLLSEIKVANEKEETKQMHIFSQTQDLNLYSDKLMKYQLERLRR